MAEYDTDAPGDYLPFASYPLLYPIQLPEVKQDGEIGLPDSVPAFYLKAFTDQNRWANFEKDAWIAVDVITTATGVGNLLKLRHLARAVEGLQYLRLAIAGLQVASGVVGTMLNFASNGNSPFCRKLRTYLFWLDLATLGADADMLFSTFLQSGMARVVLSVRPGYEEAVLYYLETGKLNGGKDTAIDDDLYGCLLAEQLPVEGIPEGEPWETRLPTTLTVLQADSVGIATPSTGLPCACHSTDDDNNNDGFKKTTGTLLYAATSIGGTGVNGLD